jgi:hypothetical protein
MHGDSCNRPVRAKALNPDHVKHDSATGDAGRDGYTRINRADRMSGARPTPSGTTPEYGFGPRYSEDY